MLRVQNRVGSGPWQTFSKSPSTVQIRSGSEAVSNPLSCQSPVTVSEGQEVERWKPEKEREREKLEKDVKEAGKKQNNEWVRRERARGEIRVHITLTSLIHQS